MNRDDDEFSLAALDSYGEAWLSAQIRTAAKIAILQRDAQDKLRRAMLRKAPKITDEVLPGTTVYFWRPHMYKGRQRRDASRWSGPATVVAKEAKGRYFLSWRGTVLLRKGFSVEVRCKNVNDKRKERTGKDKKRKKADA